MIVNLIVTVAALIIGGLCGYLIFRYGLTGKYKKMMEVAAKEGDATGESRSLKPRI